MGRDMGGWLLLQLLQDAKNNGQRNAPDLCIVVFELDRRTSTYAFPRLTSLSGIVCSTLSQYAAVRLRFCKKPTASTTLPRCARVSSPDVVTSSAPPPAVTAKACARTARESRAAMTSASQEISTELSHSFRMPKTSRCASHFSTSCSVGAGITGGGG